MSDRRDETNPAGTPPADADRERRESPTVDQLRAEIDSGHAHDKVAKSDPAAAPLGTDAEAAGAPPVGEQVARAQRIETGRSVPGQPSPSRASPQSGGRSLPIVWIIAAVLVAAILLALIL